MPGTTENCLFPSCFILQIGFHYHHGGICVNNQLEPGTLRYKQCLEQFIMFPFLLKFLHFNNGASLAQSVPSDENNF